MPRVTAGSSSSSTGGGNDISTATGAVRTNAHHRSTRRVVSSRLGSSTVTVEVNMANNCGGSRLRGASVVATMSTRVSAGMAFARKKKCGMGWASEG